jgi:hypothetical protein
LNDTLMRLGRAIAQHDADLTNGHAAEDDSEDF